MGTHLTKVASALEGLILGTTRLNPRLVIACTKTSGWKTLRCGIFKSVLKSDCDVSPFCFQSSGVGVHPDCGTAFNEIKLGHKYRYVMYRLSPDLKEIVVCNRALPSEYHMHHSQGLSQDFHNRVSKMGFQEDRVSKPPH